MKRSQSVSTFLEAQPKKTFLFLAVVLVALLYWRSLAAPFVYDDLDQIANNPNLSDWSNFVVRFLLHPVNLTSSLLKNAGSTYRPVFWLSLFVDRKAWGLDPSGYPFTNLVLHLLNGFLAFLLLLRLRLNVRAALATVLIWLSLPINTEVVAWTSGRAYLLCTLFVFAALLSALSFARRGGALPAIGAFLSSLLAVLSHDGRTNDDWFGWHAPVLAPFDGVVKMVRVNPVVNRPGVKGSLPAGQIVFQRSDGLIVAYAHITDARVKTGDYVLAGQIVAVDGNNGAAQAPHVHVGAFRNHTPYQIRWDQRAEGKLPAFR